MWMHVVQYIVFCFGFFLWVKQMSARFVRFASAHWLVLFQFIELLEAEKDLTDQITPNKQTPQSISSQEVGLNTKVSFGWDESKPFFFF